MRRIALIAVSLELLSLGIVEVHDPAGLAPDPDLDWSYPAYAHLSETGRLPSSTDGTTDIPGPRPSVACNGSSNTIFTGTRCTTFT